MNTALKTADIVDFNRFREQRQKDLGARESYQPEVANTNTPVVLWWPVWVLVPQQAVPTIQ